MHQVAGAPVVPPTDPLGLGVSLETSIPQVSLLHHTSHPQLTLLSLGSGSWPLCLILELAAVAFLLVDGIADLYRGASPMSELGGRAVGLSQ